MKALSIRQPWAWLVVNGWKNIENRDWPTRFRGRFLVHASKTMTREDYEACRLFMAAVLAWDALPLPKPEDLARGGIVGEATLLDCVTWHPSEWFTGDYGFVLADATPLPFIRCRGALGFFHANKGVTVAAPAAGDA